MINNLLKAYVDRRINEPTVILSFRILFKNQMDNGIDATMSKTEIEREFNSVHQDYGIATFRRDYVLRQCGHDENAIDQKSDRFFVKPEFLAGMQSDDYQEIVDAIDAHWGGKQIRQRQIIEEIDNLLNNESTEEQKNYIISMVKEREAIKRGQAFEVASFSILSTFLFSLGFSLNRFSTTYSNDGGIDFVAQNAIYQVTTKLNARKFDEDIQKVPGKNRVLIYKDLVESNNFSSYDLKHELVLNHIDKDELCRMLDYLVSKNSSKYLAMILGKMREEFNREFYQNDGC